MLRRILPSAPGRLSWNHYIATAFHYKITPQLLLIAFDIFLHTCPEAGA